MNILNAHMRALIGSALIVITTGTMVYHFVEEWEWMDALYFSVVTMATVGYGDHVPVTAFGKLFTIPYILLSVTIFLMLVNALSHYFHDYHIKKTAGT